MVITGGGSSCKDNNAYLNKYFLSNCYVLDIDFSTPSIKNILFEIHYMPGILVEITMVSKINSAAPLTEKRFGGRRETIKNINV